jgi:uridine kinase
VRQDTLIVAIAGGTASGKSTLARHLQDTLGADQCLLICHDRYYRDVHDPSTFNYDHPDALDTELLVEHLRALKAGDAAELPIYHYATHRRQPETERVEAAPLVIVEGILVLENEELYHAADLRVFVHAPSDLRLVRRIRRDVVERGRTLESVLNQWVSTVRTMHLEHVEPSRFEADMVIEGMGLMEPLVARLRKATRDIREQAAPIDDAITMELSGFITNP